MPTLSLPTSWLLLFYRKTLLNLLQSLVWLAHCRLVVVPAASDANTTALCSLPSAPADCWFISQYLLWPMLPLPILLFLCAVTTSLLFHHLIVPLMFLSPFLAVVALSLLLAVCSLPLPQGLFFISLSLPSALWLAACCFLVYVPTVCWWPKQYTSSDLLTSYTMLSNPSLVAIGHNHQMGLEYTHMNYFTVESFIKVKSNRILSCTIPRAIHGIWGTYAHQAHATANEWMRIFNF